VGLCEPHEVAQGQVQGQGNAKDTHRLGGEWIVHSPEEKDLWALVDEKLSVTWQCVLVAQKANLGCIKRNVASMSGDVIVLLCSALVRPHLESCIQLCSPQQRKDMELQSSKRARRRTQGTTGRSASPPSRER